VVTSEGGSRATTQRLSLIKGIKGLKLIRPARLSKDAQSKVVLISAAQPGLNQAPAWAEK